MLTTFSDGSPPRNGSKYIKRVSSLLQVDQYCTFCSLITFPVRRRKLNGAKSWRKFNLSLTFDVKIDRLELSGSTHFYKCWWESGKWTSCSPDSSRTCSGPEIFSLFEIFSLLFYLNQTLVRRVQQEIVKPPSHGLQVSLSSLCFISFKPTW